jgi:hypothetical protein
MDLKQRLVGEPLKCIDAIDMFLHPHMPTVEECVHMLLAHDEISLGMSDKRTIMLGPRVVGYIRIVAECPWESGAALHGGADGA